VIQGKSQDEALQAGRSAPKKRPDLIKRSSPLNLDHAVLLVNGGFVSLVVGRDSS
jgi:hypothetical protein